MAIRRLCALVAGAVALAAAPVPARAQDEFEIQVYDVDTAKRGEAGIEVHLNEHLLPGLPDQTHITFEPHYGLRDWLELGGYFQASLDDTGDLDYAGAKLRLKMRRPGRAWHDRIGLAINFELSDVPPQFEPNQYGSEIRPIIDLRVGRIYAAVNPIVDTDLAGALRFRPQFQPAAKLSVIVYAGVMVGTELYGAFGPFDDLGREDVERAFAVVDVQHGRWDFNAGIGASTGIPDHPIAKLIVGFQ